MPHRAQHAESFTLIELLIVIAIIGILAAIIIISLTGASTHAKYETMRAEMKEIANAANMYAVNDGQGINYPVDVGPNTMPPGLSKYLSSWPTSPWSGCTYDWQNWQQDSGTGTQAGQPSNVVGVSTSGGSCPASYAWCIYTNPGYACNMGTLVNQQ